PQLRSRAGWTGDGQPRQANAISLARQRAGTSGVGRDRADRPPRDPAAALAHRAVVRAHETCPGQERGNGTGRGVMTTPRRASRREPDVVPMPRRAYATTLARADSRRLTCTGSSSIW